MKASIYDTLLDPSDEEIIEESVDIYHDSQMIAQIKEMQEKLKEIEVKPKEIPAKRNPAPKKSRVDENNNLLNPEVRAAFVRPIYEETGEILSQPVTTTITLSGVLENVDIDEKDLSMFWTNNKVIRIKSNYDRIIQPGFEENQVPRVKSNRGRKKKPVKKKQRKVQGFGTEFNSQVTFVVITDIPDKRTSHGFLEYKFKIFQRNKLQLPGCIPAHMDNFLMACKDIIDLLNDCLHGGEQKVRLINLCPNMKNYKFYLEMEWNQILDLSLLKKLLLIDKARDNGAQPQNFKHNKTVNCQKGKCQNCFNEELFSLYHELSEYNMPTARRPKIFDVGYTREDTKLYIKFLTPIPTDPTKKVLVNIFSGKPIPLDYGGNVEPGTWGAKINILGALYEDATRDIYLYLLDLFERNYDELVVNQEIDDDEYIYIIEDDIAEDNIIIEETREEAWEFAGVLVEELKKSKK